MTKLSSASSAAVILSTMFFFAIPALAEKAYEATTENIPARMLSRIWSDGRGRMRTESNVGGVNRVSIMDLNAKVTYSIDDQSKTIMKMPFTGSPTDPDPKVQWQNIPGVKVIDGHPCTGKRAVVDGSSMETWTGTDTDCSVLVTNNGSPVMKLKSWKSINPNPALFSLPAGYKTMDMSAMMRNMQSGNFDPSKMYQH